MLQQEQGQQQCLDLPLGLSHGHAAGACPAHAQRPAGAAARGGGMLPTGQGKDAGAAGGQLSSGPAL